MAVVIKIVDGKPVFNGLSISDDAKKKALKLNEELKELGPLIEKIWREKGYKKGRGNSKVIDVEIAYGIGKKLSGVVNNEQLVLPKERYWVWKALREMYLTPNLFKYRGRKRDDLEYFYKASSLPLQFIKSISWDGWERILDYPSIRQDERFENWLRKKAKRTTKTTRGFVRKLMKTLYASLDQKDTSVFSDKELFSIYDFAWKSASSD